MNLFALAGIIVGAAAVCVGLLSLARRSTLNERFSSELGEHGRAFDFLGIAFAILLGFVVLQAYDSYNEAKRGGEQEAQAVLELTRTASAFTPEQHAHLEGTLVCYGRAVIEQGWPAMRGGGEGSPVVTDWGRVFREQAFDLDLRSVIQREAFRQLLLEQDSRIEGRRIRLAEAVRVTPTPLWFVLILGATLTVAWIVLGANRRGSFLVQAGAVASVAAMATATLALVWFLDHPFEDEAGSIRPTEMEAVLKVMDEESHAEGIEVTPPCTESGDPLDESASRMGWVAAEDAGKPSPASAERAWMLRPRHAI
jgi:hypothetical protein